jgi:hypothetical protein
MLPIETPVHAVVYESKKDAVTLKRGGIRFGEGKGSCGTSG